MVVPFDKMHGCGNDFLVVDARQGFAPDPAGAARAWCDRRFAVGGDGLILVRPSSVADWRMQILNSDGSEAEMCGNGLRCFAKYLRDHQLETRASYTVETGAGVLQPTLLEYQPARAQVCVDMGPPRLHPDQIPFIADAGSQRVVDALLQVDDDPFKITCVSMGNPHCVVFVDSLDTINVAWWGPQIERHERFPARTNVEFVEVNSPTELTMRVWERGAGQTLACGTGACATLVAAHLGGLSERQGVVHLAGGDLQIAWRETDDHVLMTGPAATSFRGELTA
ncbi:MAG: diaminopimelate epimerase [Phycisphaerales bacterium]|nr:diaminopimelate epimerase [Phycisphaerales bacterium]